MKNNCGFSRQVLLARDNLHLGNIVQVRNVSQDGAAMEELRKRTGNEQAPCLIVDGKPMLESADIVCHLATQATGLGA